jgi:hypothetical protein
MKEKKEKRHFQICKIQNWIATYSECYLKKYSSQTQNTQSLNNCEV